jgi:hypothetical protein
MIGFEKPSLVFYSGQNIQFFTYVHLAEEHFAQAEDPSKTVLLISRTIDLDKIALDPKTVEIIKEAVPYQLLRLPQGTITEKSP